MYLYCWECSVFDDLIGYYGMFSAIFFCFVLRCSVSVCCDTESASRMLFLQPLARWPQQLLLKYTGGTEDGWTSREKGHPVVQKKPHPNPPASLRSSFSFLVYTSASYAMAELEPRWVPALRACIISRASDLSVSLSASGSTDRHKQELNQNTPALRALIYSPVIVAMAFSFTHLLPVVGQLLLFFYPFLTRQSKTGYDPSWRFATSQ